MGRLLSLFLIALGSVYLIQNRFRVINVVLGNPMIRRIFITSLMSVPAIRNRMMKTVFPKPNNY